MGNLKIAKIVFTLSMLLSTSSCMKLGIRGISEALTAATCDGTATPFAGGNGTLATPWEICSRAQLERIALPAYTGNYFKLVTNIDLGGVGNQWATLNGFAGDFDGGGYTISNLDTTVDLTGGLFGNTSATIHDLNLSKVYLDRNQDEIGAIANNFSGIATNITIDDVRIQTNQSVIGGAFGYVSAATLTNITVSNILISTTSDNSAINPAALAGGVAGYIEFSDSTNISATSGSVTGLYSAVGFTTSGYVGGIFGYNEKGSISTCSSGVDVTGGVYIGGVAGTLHSPNTTHSYSGCTVSGNINGTDEVGGIAGVILRGAVSSMVSTAAILATGSNVGGIAGEFNLSNMSDSYSTGNVSGVNMVGGLAGIVNIGTITNTYSSGTIDGMSTIGGLVGSLIDASLSESFSTANVSAAGNYAGGLIGVTSQTTSTMTNSMTVADVFTTGTVTAARYAGGLIGEMNYGLDLRRSFTSGSVTAAITYAGGIFGIATSVPGPGANVDYRFNYTSAVVISAGIKDAVGTDIDMPDNNYAANYYLDQGVPGGGAAYTPIATAVAFQNQGTYGGFDFVIPEWKMASTGLPFQSPIQNWVCTSTLAASKGFTCQ